MPASVSASLRTAAQRPSTAELVALLALSTSLAALSIDSMLSSLPLIARELGATGPNDRQLVLTALLVGMGLGQILYGPASDSAGRKPAMITGFGVFILGSALSLVATSFPMMLAGRVLQGLGAAGPRIMCMALVRDQYEGPAMARIMSFVTALFILVPVLAPSLGQGVVLLASWRALFGLFLTLAAIALVWFAWRQPETLPAGKRLPFSVHRVLAGALETCRSPVSLGYTLSAGLMFGALFGYIMSSQQVLAEQYALGARFPYYFGAVALAIGAASLVNARLVMTYGMRRMVRFGLTSFVLLSLGYLVVALLARGHPPLWSLMLFLFVSFFCVGMLFGNFNALAMEPVGHIAGVAAAVIGSITTVVSVATGTIIGQSYSGTVLPLVTGFACLSSAALVLVTWVERRRATLVP